MLTSAVSVRIAIIALGYLIYTTLVREIDNMLAPPMDWGAVYAYIDQITMTAARNQVCLRLLSSPAAPHAPIIVSTLSAVGAAIY
jgi:hypothetical protein